MKIKYLTLILLVVANQTLAENDKPSFDCAKASTQIEKEICSDNQNHAANEWNGFTLQKLDSKLGQTYSDLMIILNSKQSANLKIDQKNWLLTRVSCLKLNLKSKDCLRKMYKDRIMFLAEKYLSSKSSMPSLLTSDSVIRTNQGPDEFFKNFSKILVNEKSEYENYIQADEVNNFINSFRHYLDETKRIKQIDLTDRNRLWLTTQLSKDGSVFYYLAEQTDFELGGGYNEQGILFVAKGKHSPYQIFGPIVIHDYGCDKVSDTVLSSILFESENRLSFQLNIIKSCGSIVGSKQIQYACEILNEKIICNTKGGEKNASESRKKKHHFKKKR